MGKLTVDRLEEIRTGLKHRNTTAYAYAPPHIRESAMKQADHEVDQLCDLALAALGGGWKPIETYVPDGKPILAYNPMMGAYNTSAVKMREPVTKWGHKYPVSDYEFPCGYSNGEFGEWFCVPTHWQPLPAGPSAPSD